MPNRKKKDDVFEGSGNVFADLGRPDPINDLRKAELALAINSWIRARRLTQTKAAEILGIDQPKVSALSTGRLSLFSLETLIRYIVLLGGEVDVVIRRPAEKAQIPVVRPEAISPTRSN